MPRRSRWSVMGSAILRGVTTRWRSPNIRLRYFNDRAIVIRRSGSGRRVRGSDLVGVVGVDDQIVVFDQRVQVLLTTGGRGWRDLHARRIFPV